MRRKFWIIISILSALISGMFLYEGGRLFFWFHDRRGGFVVLISGIAVFVLFVRGVWRSIQLDQERISHENLTQIQQNWDSMMIWLPQRRKNRV